MHCVFSAYLDVASYAGNCHTADPRCRKDLRGAEPLIHALLLRSLAPSLPRFKVSAPAAPSDLQEPFPSQVTQS
eukprot:3749568-Rhodomonas_salina.2